MITEDLYKVVLNEPAVHGGANTLYIVSGYASASFALRHLKDLLDNNKKVCINLIIGMNNRSEHLAYIRLQAEYPGQFKGYYIDSAPWVHSKVYTWFRDSEPVIGYSGSANYSQFGFVQENIQQNQIDRTSAIELKKYYDTLLIRAVSMDQIKVDLPIGHPQLDIQGSVSPGNIHWEIPDKRVTISFLDKKGNLPTKSGLNWGQRTAKNFDKASRQYKIVSREPNQAYLSIKGDSRKDGFLPPTAINFTLETDDGFVFDCVVAQDGRKAVESTRNNSELGLYFRKRLGLKPGDFIESVHLERYGRTDFTLEKLNDELFLLDFSPH